MSERAAATGREPLLTGTLNGYEPMLGGRHRHRVDRVIFWGLLDFDPYRRTATVLYVVDRGEGRFYGSVLASVLHPDARYHRAGFLWKVRYSVAHKLAAMSSLVHVDPERALRGLILALDNEQAQLRQAALNHIASLESIDAENVLLAVLEDNDIVLHRGAVRALAARWELPELYGLANVRAGNIRAAISELPEEVDPRVLFVLASLLRRTWESKHILCLVTEAVLRVISRLATRASYVQLQAVISAINHLLTEDLLKPDTAYQAIDTLHDVSDEGAVALAIVHRARLDALNG